VAPVEDAKSKKKKSISRMKKILLGLVLLASLTISAQKATQKHTQLNDQIVEASCGQCQFGMNAKGCDLAIRIDGKSYFVVGTKIDDHGDAHAKDGFCETIRKAKVTGEIKENTFVASSFILVPVKQE
jgi:Family of unknown function (DUF6370)